MSIIPIQSLLNGVALRYENGRTYLRDWLDVYPYPCASDDHERQRAEILHMICCEAFQTLLQAVLPFAPGRRYRILDLGSGCRTWAAEMVHSRPDVEVVGLDLGDGAGYVNDLITKALAARNCNFLSGVDFESPNWRVQPGSFDVVRCALLAGCVSDWPLLLQRIKRVLKPGGQVELIEIDWRADSVFRPPSNSLYIHWCQEVAKASREFGKPLVGVVDMIQQSLEQSGFSITRHGRERLDVAEECGFENMDLHNLLARRHFELMTDPELGHLEALSMRLLTQRGATPAQVRSLCNAARQELSRESDEPVNRWQPFHVLHAITARRSLR